MEHDHGHIEHLLHSIDAIDLATVLSISWFSFIMSWHCAAMCGPLACARFAHVTAAKNRLWLHVVLYNFGRIVSYSTMGAIVASASEFLIERLPLLGTVLAIAFSLIVACQGILLIFNKEFSWAPKLLVKLGSQLTIWSNRLNGGAKTFLFGLVTVFLPCMTLGSALAAAAMTTDLASGFLVMFGFALGTVPVMAALPFVSSNLSTSLARKLPLPILRRVAGLFLMIVSGLTVFRIFP